MPQHTEKQQELLVEIGRRLKAAREGQGLTLQDVATRTRIHSAYLDKIEQGVTDGLPALTFVRGFMRNYMQTLGVDDHEFTEAMTELGQTQQSGPLLQPLTSATTDKLLGMETEKTNWTKWLLIGALVLLVAWVAYLVVRVSTSSDTPPAPAATPAAPAPSAPANPAAPAAPAAPGPGQSALPGAPGRPTAAAEPRANLRLTVRGLEDTWVRMATDRQPAVEVLIHPAETLTFEANEEIRLTVGKSQGVSLYLNGEEVALPTAKNRLVSELVLNKLSLLKMQN
jgi:cytoskeletal protein RodZ